MSFSISFIIWQNYEEDTDNRRPHHTRELWKVSLFIVLKLRERERARRLTREQWKSTLLTRPFILFLSLYLFHCAKAQNAAFFSLQRWSEFKHNCSNQRCMLKCLVLTQYLCKTWTDRLLTPKLQQIIPYLILI